MLGHVLRRPRSAPQAAAVLGRSVIPWFRPMRLPAWRAPSYKAAPASSRGFRFSAWRRYSDGADKSDKLSLSQRLRKLFKDYGRAAIGVYLAISVLDFPFCFLLVRVIGVETIGNMEHRLVSTLSQLVPQWVKDEWHRFRSSPDKTDSATASHGDVGEAMEMMSWGVGTAQKHHDEEASLGTQLALAYAIHKSFIFVRVPLTAAVTPKIVKILVSWGWKIGKRRN